MLLAGRRARQRGQHKVLPEKLKLLAFDIPSTSQLHSTPLNVRNLVTAVSFLQSDIQRLSANVVGSFGTTENVSSRSKFVKPRIFSCTALPQFTVHNSNRTTMLADNSFVPVVSSIPRCGTGAPAAITTPAGDASRSTSTGGNSRIAREEFHGVGAVSTPTFWTDDFSGPPRWRGVACACRGLNRCLSRLGLVRKRREDLLSRQGRQWSGLLCTVTM